MDVLANLVAQGQDIRDAKLLEGISFTAMAFL